MAAVAGVHGQLDEAERLWTEANVLNRRIGRLDRVIEYGLSAVLLRARVQRDPRAAQQRLDRLLAEQPLESIPPLDRPYLAVAFNAVAAGRTAQGKALVEQYTRVMDPGMYDEAFLNEIRTGIFVAEGRIDDALATARAAMTRGCIMCGLSEIARVFDAAGNADSALVAWKRYVETPSSDRLIFDHSELAHAYERLGQLYDARGDRRQAADYYNRFIELWRDADPVLQPRVRAARERLIQITRESG
jgi:predicted Zn-dependent protease